MPEQIFRQHPATVKFADNLVLGHDNIVEEGFAERRVARNQLDRLCRNAWRFHIEQQEADALIFICLVGADEAENPVGLIGIGCPDFLAVYDPMVALVLAIGLHRHKSLPDPGSE